MLHACERDTPRVQQLRQPFVKTIADHDVKRLKFLDESSVQINLTRLDGWAASAERVVDSVPDSRGSNVTVLTTMGLTAIQAAVRFAGALTGELFQVYGEHGLASTLPDGDLVSMDNLRAHTVSGSVEPIERRGAQVWFLPPDSPDRNPIELCWSKVKRALRQAKARTVDALPAALTTALESVSLTDILHWFTHRAYYAQ